MREFERFDMKEPPRRQSAFLGTLAYALSIPDIIKHRPTITKIETENLKPPYVLLCNHNAFMDFKVAIQCTYPNKANYVVAIDGFLKRENLLRNIGCICKRKFTNDITLVRQLKRVIDNGDIAVIYPEARYSLCGTTAVLPESLGKLCKLLNVPVVTLICHGHHINSPFWNLHDRGVKPTEAEFRLLIQKDELKSMTPDEINRKIVDVFQYDEYAWQKEKGIKVTYSKRAEGLDRVLYQCPSCRREFRMKTEGDRLFCPDCGKSWRYTELGELRSEDGQDIFTHIPDWYEWERANVRDEVERGVYSSGVLPVKVDSLPNAKGYIRLGNGTMVHDMNGFRVECTGEDGEVFTMEKSVPSLYSCHIEYNYLGKFGDCVDLNTLSDTWYIYPYDAEFSVTKMALATEELYFRDRKDKGMTLKPGLA